MKESIFCNVPDFFCLKNTQREIGHSMGTPRHLKDTCALGRSKEIQGTWALTVFGYLGTGRVREHSVTQAIGTWALKTLEALYLADSSYGGQ